MHREKAPSCSGQTAKSANSTAPAKSGVWFYRFARWIAFHAGRPNAFFISIVVIIAWAGVGPMFDYSDTWQLVINTGTTIVTFLMVFLIQNTQNRDSQALHLKLDELIRAMKGARNVLLDLDELSDEELEKIRANFARIAARAKNGDADTKVTAAPKK